MKNKIGSACKIALSIAMFWSSSSLACTGFMLQQNGKSYVAKNFDRPLAQGKMLVNARHVSKMAFPAFLPLTPARWVSKYGSVTLNQAGINFHLAV